MNLLTLPKLTSLVLALTTLGSANLVAKQQDALQSMTADPGVINYERIEYWLKKRGELAPNATQTEIDKKLQQYTSKARAYVVPEVLTELKQQAQKRALKSKIQSKSASIPKTVKVLAVMIDFPDLPYDNNRLSASDTSMYYPSYPVSHYQDLMFSETGYQGPSGQNVMSGYQFYQAESGGEFFFTGTAYGWVTADSDAAVYGANDPDRNDNDIDAPSLIEEAVAKAVAANSIDLTSYDVEDPYDADGDGNLNEPDGFVDHVMVYHSSVGEEAGGGVLGEDAIWSHRFYVNQTGSLATMGYAIPGTDKRLFGYTVQPIDAATGVVVHEFGHDLGLPDEYDTGESNKGSPVGMWSVMASGSWAGSPQGTKPVGFSTYARSELQQDHGANFINEQEVIFDDLNDVQTIELVEAVNHTANTINQVKITLPNSSTAFNPFAGDYQYYSGEGHNLNNTMTLSLTLPDSDALELTMKAHWNIEKDWDFVRVLINDVAIAGNHTTATNPYTGQYDMYDDANNYISDKSEGLAGAQGAASWVDLSFDISAYKNQTVTLKIEYRTDSNTGGYGFVADQIKVLNSSTEISNDGAETASATLAGFTRNQGWELEGDARNYWVQLRSHNGVDQGLTSRSYNKGVVIWYSDNQYTNNQSSAHPGGGLIGVVDANQTLIGTQSSSTQVRDAAFGLNGQASAVFNDSTDYSQPLQPESGIILPELGLIIEVTAEAADSSTATINISKAGITSAGFDYTVSGTQVSFTDSSTASSGLTYNWDFGDGSLLSTEANPVHNYAAEGVYQVTLTITDADMNSDSFTATVVVGSPASASFSSTIAENVVTFTNTTSGGIGNVTYSWNFGDDNVSTEESPVHTYTAAGNFTVVLTVTDDAGTTSQSSSVTVGTALSADFSFSVSDKTVTFTNLSAGGLGDLTYLWDFADGTTSTDASPSHTYPADNTYTVELTVTDGFGNESTSSKTVTIDTAPPPSSGGGGSLLWLLAVIAPLSVRRRK
jgi:immune inhibitor A